MFKIMKFFNKNVMVFAVFCGIVSPVSAHVHRIEHWSNNSQSLYLVHDYHISSEPQNKICDQQQHDLLEAAKQHNAFVVTEDMSVYNNKAFFTDPLNYDPNIPPVHKHRKKHPTTRPPIVGLTVHCQDQKIPVHNVEFRQASVASRNGEKRISAQLALAISDKVRDEIYNYNDSPILNNYYQEEVSLYDRNLSNARPIFEPIRNSDKPLKEVSQQLVWCDGADAIVVSGTHFDEQGAQIWGKASRVDMATNLYDMRLLDARIIHTIHQNKNRSCMFICVGSEHLRHIKPVLEKIGFERTGRVGESYITPDGVSTEPDAIDVSKAFETLPKPVQPKTDAINLWMVLCAIAFLMILMFFGKKKTTKNIKTAAGILLFFATIFTQSSLYGYIYCVDVLESPQYKTKIVLLSDRHEIGSHADVQQRKELTSWIKEAKVHTAIEDGGSYTLEKLGITIPNEVKKAAEKKSSMAGLDKEIGSHLVTNIDRRVSVAPKLDANFFWGTESIKSCKEKISELRKTKHATVLNRYKNDILLELQNKIIPQCEALFEAINKKSGTISDRMKAIQYESEWDYIIQSHMARASGNTIDRTRYKKLTPLTKIQTIMTIYDSSLLDAAACNFINSALQQEASVICLVLGGAHMATIMHPLTDKKMGFTRNTIVGKTIVQAQKTNFEPVQNLKQILKKIYYPSFFAQGKGNITLAGSVLLSLYIGNTFGSNKSTAIQLGLTLGTFFGSLTGYHLIRSGWNYLTKMFEY